MGDNYQLMNKKLVGMKRKAESSLLGEQKKLAKVEAELQEKERYVPYQTSMKEVTQANKRLSEDIVRIKCDPLSENPALPANIEFELEAILSVQVVF